MANQDLAYQASPLTRVLSTSFCRSVLNLASLCSLVSSCAAMFAASAFRWLDSGKESRAGRAKATEGLEAPPADESGTRRQEYIYCKMINMTRMTM